MSTTVTLELLECSTEFGSELWGGTVIGAASGNSGAGRRVLTVWGTADDEQLQARLLSTTGKFPEDLLAQKQQKQTAKGYLPSRTVTLEVVIAAGGESGFAKEVSPDDESKTSTAGTGFHSWIIQHSGTQSLTLPRTEVEARAQEMATLSFELLTNTPEGQALFQLGEDRIVLCDDIVRTPNGICLDPSSQQLAGTGQFQNWKTVLFLEYLCRRLNTLLSEEVYSCTLTVNGESSIHLKDWKSISATAQSIDPDVISANVRDLAEKLELIQPIFDVAKAMTGSSVESFF